MMSVKMRLEKQIASLNTALDKEKSSQCGVSDQMEELQAKNSRLEHELEKIRALELESRNEKDRLMQSKFDMEKVRCQVTNMYLGSVSRPHLSKAIRFKILG